MIERALHSLRSRNGRDLAREVQIFLLGSLRDKPVTKTVRHCRRRLHPRASPPCLGGGMPAATNLRIMICAASPALLHRVAVMSAGTLDSLPHNGAVLTPPRKRSRWSRSLL